MEIRTYKVFTFDELTDEQKQKAIQKLSDINIDDDYWFDIDEYFETEAQEHGFDVAPKKEWTFDLYRKEYDFGIFIDDKIKVLKWILSANKYKHKKLILHLFENDFLYLSSDGDVSLSELGYILPRYKYINKVIDELYSDIDQAKSELEYGIFKKLQKQYDYYTSDESIIETIKANEYMFDENGDID